MKLTNISNTEKITYEYYKNGYSIEEIAEERDLVESTIYGHISSLILNKLIDLNEIVGNYKKEKILNVIENEDFETLIELKEKLGQLISYGEIKCVLAYTKIQKNSVLLKAPKIIKKNTNNIIKRNIQPELKINIFTVNEITKYIKNKIENDNKLNNLFVRGEISNLKNYDSGHSYFILKDEKSQIKCILFSRTKNNLKFELEDGMKIILEGSIEVYEPRGEYSLIIKNAQPDGLGSLHLAFIQLKEKLEKEGLFLKKYKKALPKFPENIGIITSLSAAALQDILKVIKKRYPLVGIKIVPALVQGKSSANSIVKAIKVMNNIPDIDVIILGRGGGSIEDLWSFNEEIVAREIFKSNIPIISAVGHETDFTISDFVADKRAPTPSAAAETVVPDMKEIYRQINNLNTRANRSIKSKIELYKSNLKQMNIKSIFKKIIDIINSNHRVLDNNRDILEEIVLNNIRERKKDIEIVNLKIEALNPKSILKRGYSIVMKKNKVLTNYLNLKKGEDINIILHKGIVEAEVKKLKNK